MLRQVIQIAAVVCSLAFSISARADMMELVSLSCRGLNGLEVELTPESDIIETKLYGLTRTFESNRRVFIYTKNNVSITRVTLGTVGAANVYRYDIYLSNVPTEGQVSKLGGVIGRTVYGVIAFPAYPAPIPMPVGFFPSTSLECQILTN